MQDHNTLHITLDQHSSLVTANMLMMFFINLLDHDEESVFELERDALIFGLKEVHSMIQKGLKTDLSLVDKNTWSGIDSKMFKTPWDGWLFKDGLLWDDDGNHYTPKGVKMSWQSEMIINGHIGSQSNIRTMKEHLINLRKDQELKAITVLINGKKVVFTPNVSS